MIAIAFERNSLVYIYDVKGQQISFITLRGGASLLSFTANNVNISDGKYIYIYNERGILTGTIHCL